MAEEAPDQKSVDKLRRLVEELDEQSDLWTDDKIFWRVREGFEVTAGDLRAWLVIVDGERPGE